MGSNLIVVDYEGGNVRSVLNAIEFLGHGARLTREAGALREASHIILPGVGAFSHCMEGLRTFGLDEILQEEVVGKGKKFLGICVGMQLLARVGYEFGESFGLGWLDAACIKLKSEGDSSLRLPHVGWNSVTADPANPLFDGIPASSSFYFVHSFHLEMREPGVSCSLAEYGQKFAAAVSKGNIFGVQFHPEKSQDAGLKLLDNFCRL